MPVGVLSVMPRRGKNAVNGIEAVVPLAGMTVLMWMIYPPARQAVMALFILLVLGGLAALLVIVIFRVFNDTNGSAWEFGRHRILRGSRPLHSYDLATLEAVEFKPAAEPPTAAGDERIAPVVTVSPSPIITRQATTRPTAELIEQLRAIDWFQFEKVVALMYRKQGYAVTRRGGANPDGGIDLVIQKNGVRKGVQCKQWKHWKIPEKTVRELVGALHIEGIERGVLVSLGGCTDPARSLAQKQGIELLEEAQLSRCLEAADASYDPELLELLEDRRKYCPKCESEMVLRTAKEHPHHQFWGCSTYPRCHFMMKLD
jgi:restriction system protein